MKNSEIKEGTWRLIAKIYDNADFANQILNITCGCKLIRSKINDTRDRLGDSEFNEIERIVDRIEADIKKIGKCRRISQNAVEMLKNLIRIYSIEAGVEY